MTTDNYRAANEAQAFIRQFQGQPGYDQLQASVISGVAKTDVLMAKQLADQLAAQWYARDPAAATHRASNLPGGSIRDDAIMHMSSGWGEPTVEQQNLVASIEDREKRGRAKIRQIYQVLRTNPAKAREMLEDEDIPSHQREQVETMISSRTSPRSSN